MNYERLQLVLDIIKPIPKEKFSMETWWNTHLSCGCAIGHSARDPRMIAEGLSLKNTRPRIGITFQGDMTSFQALAIFFDISLEDTEYLFSATDYDEERHLYSITPDHVIERIKELIARAPDYTTPDYQPKS